jgi:hypothetical protein
MPCLLSAFKDAAQLSVLCKQVVNGCTIADNNKQNEHKQDAWQLTSCAVSAAKPHTEVAG